MGGGSSKTQTTKTEPWEPAQDALKRILSDAENLYNEKGGINAEWIDREVADLTPEMQGVIKDMLASDEMKTIADNLSASAQPGTEGIATAAGALSAFARGEKEITSDQINKMAQDLYQSDLVKQQKAQLTEDVKEGLASNIQALNQQAAATGNMGSSRAGVAEGVATTGAAKAIAQGSASIENAARESAYGQALNTLGANQSAQMGAATSLGNVGVQSGYLQNTASGIYQQNLQNSLTAAGITQEQATIIADNKWFNQQGAEQAGWANLGNLMSVGATVGGAGGSTTSPAQGGGQTALGTGLGIVGGVVGAIYGGGPAGASAGYTIGSGVGNAVSNSDASLKKNVKRKKKSEHGKDAEYTWEWNDSAKKRKGLEGKASGVLAQQIAKEKPEAVKTSSDGALMVDYAKTTAEAGGNIQPKKGNKGQ